MTNIELMFSNRQTAKVSENILKSIQSVINSGQFIMGSAVPELEQKLANFYGHKHGIACANGTDALMLALMAFDLQKDEVVFTPSFTFIATAEAIAVLGGIPYFVDVESNGFNISLESLESSIQDAISKGMKIRGIISVDLFGHTVDYDALSSIAKKYNLFFISDAAQSFGARHKSNTKADITTTSFFPTKPLGCYGDGGMMFTNSDELAQTLRSLTMHGKGLDKYHNVRVGTNSRLDTIQAVVLLEKFKHFENEISKRNELADFYNSSLKDIITTPAIISNTCPVWAVYTLLYPKRDLIIEKLKKVGIPSNIYYHTPLHMQVAYLEYPRAGILVNSEKYSKECFCLPMHAYITKEEREFIVSELKTILQDLDENN